MAFLAGAIPALLGGLFGGPSAAQKQDLSQQQNIGLESSNFFNQWMQNANTTFGEQQNILNGITSNLMPILQGGPGQQGFTPQENAALNTQAINSAGGNYQNAKVALGNGAGGNNIVGGATPGGTAGPGTFAPGTSGAQNQLNEELASSEAGNLSNAQNQITQANYAQGNANWKTALSSLGNTATTLAPNSYATTANNIGNQAFNQYGTLGKEQQQMDASNPWLKMLGGIGGGISGLVGSGINAIGSAVQNVGSGGLGNALSSLGDAFGG